MFKIRSEIVGVFSPLGCLLFQIFHPFFLTPWWRCCCAQGGTLARLKINKTFILSKGLVIRIEDDNDVNYYCYDEEWVVVTIMSLNKLVPFNSNERSTEDVIPQDVWRSLPPRKEHQLDIASWGGRKLYPGSGSWLPTGPKLVPVEVSTCRG